MPDDFAHVVQPATNVDNPSLAGLPQAAEPVPPAFPEPVASEPHKVEP